MLTTYNFIVNDDSNTTYYIQLPYDIDTDFIGWSVKFAVSDDSQASIVLKNAFPGATSNTAGTHTVAGGVVAEYTYMGSENYYSPNRSGDFWLRTSHIDNNW